MFILTRRKNLRLANDVVENLTDYQRMAAGHEAATHEPTIVCTSIADLLARWDALGRWAVKGQHGAAAKLAVMFALSLQRPTSAHATSIQYLRPRVWVVSTPYGACTQRAALLDDELVGELLTTIGATAGHPTPVFPKTPCGSTDIDGWVHAMASRRGHRGMKNFVALLADFGLPALKSPFEIYQLSLFCFTCCFIINDRDRRALLASQQGCKRAPPALRLSWLPQTIGDPFGELNIEGRDTLFMKGVAKPALQIDA